MQETYPIFLSEEQAGTLTIARRGLYTGFYARCTDPGILVRLSVYGGGKEGYLGVMEPENGALTLRRQLSRSAMVSFPASIEYAAEAGRRPSESAAPDLEPETPDEESPPEQERNTDLLWYPRGDGSLVTTWRGRQYRAFPMAAWGLPMEQAVERRTIDGVEYAVFALTDEHQNTGA